MDAISTNELFSSEWVDEVTYQFYKDFELSCLFRDDMFPGCFEKDENGEYVSAKMKLLLADYIVNRLRATLDEIAKEAEDELCKNAS